MDNRINLIVVLLLSLSNFVNINMAYLLSLIHRREKISRNPVKLMDLSDEEMYQLTSSSKVWSAFSVHVDFSLIYYF